MARDNLTPFGKLVRRYRLELGILLKEMAEGMSMSSAWLSGIETGRKPISRDLVEKVSRYLNLDLTQRSELEVAAEQSKTTHSISHVLPDRRDVAAALARRLNEFDQKDLDALRAILHRRNK